MTDNNKALQIQSAQMAEIFSNIVLKGDISQLKPVEKVQYYNAVCERIGLDPMTQPFALLELTRNGKKVELLYARKECAEQLRMIHKISVVSIESKQSGDIFIVSATVATNKGQTDISTGAVSTKGLYGDALANAFMKAETKAKRRATLSICGLGMLDESEVETIPDAKQLPIQAPPKNGKTYKSKSEMRGAPIHVDVQDFPPPDWDNVPEEVGEHTVHEPASTENISLASPAPASNGKDSRLTEWLDIAKREDPKHGEERFIKAFNAALAKRRVKKFDQLSIQQQDAVVAEVRMVVEAMIQPKK